MTALVGHAMLVLSGFLLFQGYLAGAQGRLMTMIICGFLAGTFTLIGWVLA